MLYQQSVRGNCLEKQASEGNLRSNIHIMGIAVSVEVINEEKVQVAADNLLTCTFGMQSRTHLLPAVYQ